MLQGVVWSKGLHVTKPTKKDFKTLADNLRQADANELKAIDHLIPFETMIKKAVRASKESYTLWDNKRLICILGVAEGNSCGIPWLLATTTHRFMLRNARLVVANLKAKYKTLINYIHVDNTVHIRWLKALGFEIYVTDNTNFYIFKMTG